MITQNTKMRLINLVAVEIDNVQKIHEMLSEVPAIPAPPVGMPPPPPTQPLASPIVLEKIIEIKNRLWAYQTELTFVPVITDDVAPAPVPPTT